MNEQFSDGVRNLLAERGGSLIDRLDKDEQAHHTVVLGAFALQEPRAVLAHRAANDCVAPDPDAHACCLPGERWFKDANGGGSHAACADATSRLVHDDRRGQRGRRPTRSRTAVVRTECSGRGA